MSRPLSPAMRTALMEVEILGYSAYEAAKRNGVHQSGISRQINKPKAQNCPACGQKIKANHSAPEAPQVE